LTVPVPAVTGPLPARTADVANGETMFHIGGCAACHATPRTGPRRMTAPIRLGGGLALVTPFGTFKGPYISPIPVHGIRAWSDEAYVNVMLRGIGRTGERLYPALAYKSHQHMARHDQRDLSAYVKTLPPVGRPSEPHGLPFQFNIRRGI